MKNMHLVTLKLNDFKIALVLRKHFEANGTFNRNPTVFPFQLRVRMSQLSDSFFKSSKYIVFVGRIVRVVALLIFITAVSALSIKMV